MMYQEYINLLIDLVNTPSHSTKEDKTAGIIENFLRSKGVHPRRLLNNVWVRSRHFNPERPTLLLNSHHDTIRPTGCWIHNPFRGVIEDGKLYGLGSNDAGGALVSLMATFLALHQRDDLQFNLIFAATAEEENSGTNGIEAILPELGRIDLAIVGEPTCMEMAIAERGLVVLDCIARGKAGHAARNTGINAIDIAITDIQWLHSYQFPKVSELLGPVKMTCTVIQAGKLHNVIPDECRFTVDVRTTDAYTNEEVVAVIRQHLKSEVIPRSTRLQPSAISPEHPIVKAAQQLNIRCFGSPTTSDQAVIPVDSVKIGPGDSNRSHTTDEFIYIDEIIQGIELYQKLLLEFNQLIRESNQMVENVVHVESLKNER